MFLKRILCGLTFVAALSATATAQTTDTQKFTVTVPSNISIIAPLDVALTHDQSDANQSFPTQRWTVVGNTAAGVTVSFTTDSPFVHTTDPTHKRDASVGLALASNTGPGAWNITQVTDTTDYVNNDDTAVVSAASNGPGSAAFDLAVTFITDTFGTFAAGDYETTVTGTVTAN
ncbi:MAG: hypothetical protein AAGD07_09175 [Planctomycetota bacterium]